MDVPHLNALVNVIAALVMAFAGARVAYKIHKVWPVIFTFLGLYWAAFYAYALLFEYQDAAAIGETFVRPANTITYALIASVLFIVEKLWTRKA